MFDAKRNISFCTLCTIIIFITGAFAKKKGGGGGIYQGRTQRGTLALKSSKKDKKAVRLKTIYHFINAQQDMHFN